MMIIERGNTKVCFCQETLAVTVEKDQTRWEWADGFQPKLICKEGSFSFLDAVTITHETYTMGVGIGIRSCFEGFEKDGVTYPYAFETLIWMEDTTEQVYFEWVPLKEEGLQVEKVLWPGQMAFEEKKDSWYTLLTIASSDIKDNFAETLVNNYVRDGKNYAVPKDFDTNALWYNKDLFDQAGVEYPTDDMTYDDLVALATELKDKLPDGVYPFACPVDFQTWYYQTVYANGGWILNDDATETGYGDAKTQEGIQCWIDMIDAGLSPSASTLSETGSDAMFEGEQIAMTLAGSYMVPEYASNDTIKDKIDCVEVPTFNGVEDNCINGLGFAVYEGSKQKEEAEKFAIWMGSSEAQKIQGETGVVISAREDAQQYFAKANEQYNLAAYTNHSAEAYPLPVCSKAAELYDMESTWLTKAYTGEMSLADACSGLKEEADALLAK